MRGSVLMDGRLRTRVTPVAWFLFVATIYGNAAFAQKTNQSLIEDPFDTAAGGAHLTRSARENVVLANPALMPYGAKFHRWLGTSFAVSANKDAVDFGRSMMSGAEGAGSAAEGGMAEMVRQVFDTPVRVGAMNITSYTTNNFGISVFMRSDFDLSAREFNDFAMPEVSLWAEAYAGAAAGFGFRIIEGLSIGVTGKYLAAAEPQLNVALTNLEALTELMDPAALQDMLSYGFGLGFDAGALYFLQGDVADLRFAFKVDDIGGTSFSGTQSAFRQIMHAGVGLTFHGRADSLHLSLDYRDIEGIYEEALFKKIYAGARFNLRSYLAVAGGLYQGYPSMGVRVNLWLLKLGATMFTRELGRYPGENPRTMYMFQLLTGF